MCLIQLLHLSDIHLAQKFRFFRPFSISITRFNAVARLIHEYLNEIDGVIVTGDIADTGRKEDLDFAKALLFPQYQEPRIVQRIASTRISSLHLKGKLIIIIPGNHDRFDYPTCFPGSKNFDEIFADQWKNSDSGVDFHLLPDYKNPRLMIVCADLSLKDKCDCPLGLYPGRGMAYSDRLEELMAITDKAKDYGEIPVIWALHFFPDTPEDPIGSDLKLNNSIDLLEAAETACVKYIFCGHIHKAKKQGSEKNVWIYSAGTATVRNILKPHHQSVSLIKIMIKNNAIDDLEVYPFKWDGKTFC